VEEVAEEEEQKSNSKQQPPPPQLSKSESDFEILGEQEIFE
jgi:hypothetical protein